ncbi:MAG: cyclodeaminase/cyclohydrolase family protein [Lachnospiraceae bacterium]|nr:cyclodeaminase/cyclohydrolase family protein [Lachnospiraceae bacterium]
MEKFVKYSLEEFVDALASKAAVPGGGGASALAASLGIALGNMVGEFTVGKKKYADAEEELRVCMARAKDLSRKFLNCIERDAAAFEPLSRAYAIPKDDKNRDIVMENCLRDAAKVPMEILRLVCEAIKLEERFAVLGSMMIQSDAAVGASILRSSLLGAAVNVKINTKSMKDREYADSVNKEVDALVEEYLPLADSIFEHIYHKYA